MVGGDLFVSGWEQGVLQVQRIEVGVDFDLELEVGVLEAGKAAAAGT